MKTDDSVYLTASFHIAERGAIRTCIKLVAYYVAAVLFIYFKNTHTQHIVHNGLRLNKT